MSKKIEKIMLLLEAIALGIFGLMLVAGMITVIVLWLINA